MPRYLPWMPAMSVKQFLSYVSCPSNCLPQNRNFPEMSGLNGKWRHALLKIIIKYGWGLLKISSDLLCIVTTLHNMTASLFLFTLCIVPNILCPILWGLGCQWGECEQCYHSQICIGYTHPWCLSSSRWMTVNLSQHSDSLTHNRRGTLWIIRFMLLTD